MEENTDKRKKPVMPFFKSEIDPNPAFNMEKQVFERIFEGSSDSAREFYLKDVERIRASMQINRSEESLINLDKIKKIKRI
jgi:hypothetical protein